MNKLSRKTVILVSLIYLILAVFIYNRLALTFFQQDEWVIFGNLIYWDKADLNWFQRLFVYEQSTHLTPFGNLLSYFQFKLFKENFSLYAWLAILLHSLNSFLVFILAFKVIKKLTLSFLSGILFLMNSFSHQAFTWIATMTGTAGNCIFLLLSLIFFKKGRFLLSLFFLIFSLGFKETSLFLLAFFPIAWLIYVPKVNLKSAKKFFTPIIMVGFFYLLIRILLKMNAPPVSGPPEEFTQPGLKVYLYRLFTLPIKGIVQSFVPASIILSLSRVLVVLAYPYFVSTGGIANPYLVESTGADIVIFLIFVTLIFLLVLVKKIIEKKIYWQALIFSFSFIALGSLLFAVIPGKAGYFSIYEPRHLYLLSIGSVIGIVILFSSAINHFFKKNYHFWLIVFFFPLFLYHFSVIEGDINKLVKLGKLRKEILEQIFSSYPRLQSKVIFYMESDTAFYGLPPEEKIFPFQSGLGQTLLVWYNFKGENFPVCLYRDQYLYVLLSEGYKECQGRGFGYFRKFDGLTKAIRENNLGKENVIAFEYNSQRQSLTDITLKIRRQLK